MALWKVEPTWKKSLYDRQYWDKDGKTIIIETGWRWGEFTIQTPGDEPPVIEEGDDLFCLGDDIELVDWSTDDGCWEDIEYLGFTDDERDEMEDWIEDNGTWDMEDNGWSCGDAEMIVGCEVTIERIE